MDKLGNLGPHSKHLSRRSLAILSFHQQPPIQLPTATKYSRITNPQHQRRSPVTPTIFACPPLTSTPLVTFPHHQQSHQRTLAGRLLAVVNPHLGSTQAAGSNCEHCQAGTMSSTPNSREQSAGSEGCGGHADSSSPSQDILVTTASSAGSSSTSHHPTSTGPLAPVSSSSSSVGPRAASSQVPSADSRSIAKRHVLPSSYVRPTTRSAAKTKWEKGKAKAVAEAPALIAMVEKFLNDERLWLDAQPPILTESVYKQLLCSLIPSSTWEERDYVGALKRTSRYDHFLPEDSDSESDVDSDSDDELHRFYRMSKLVDAERARDAAKVELEKYVERELFGIRRKAKQLQAEDGGRDGDGAEDSEDDTEEFWRIIRGPKDREEGLRITCLCTAKIYAELCQKESEKNNFTRAVLTDANSWHKYGTDFQVLKDGFGGTKTPVLGVTAVRVSPATFIITKLYISHNKWDTFLSKQQKHAARQTQDAKDIYEGDELMCIAHFDTARLCTVATRKLDSRIGVVAGDLTGLAGDEDDEDDEGGQAGYEELAEQVDALAEELAEQLHAQAEEARPGDQQDLV
ncbi:hypothetical protein BJ508DRAFT_337795 [Ascobolus immersus RN42]|uniref:Uncharacterized protein n=1 Tax=Ascobolus immersus RN42 TaxID=1160509 RepID=A0A3N4HV34_ASCIM|nr:hypothetical protein BJ508DRAFT_337795 [Ascobolus immersus RN42]